MAHVWLWFRYGCCTGLGLLLIGVAALSVPGQRPEASPMPHPGPDTLR